MGQVFSGIWPTCQRKMDALVLDSSPSEARPVAWRCQRVIERHLPLWSTASTQFACSFGWAERLHLAGEGSELQMRYRFSAHRRHKAHK